MGAAVHPMPLIPPMVAPMRHRIAANHMKLRLHAISKHAIAALAAEPSATDLRPMRSASIDSGSAPRPHAANMALSVAMSAEGGTSKSSAISASIKTGERMKATAPP